MESNTKTGYLGGKVALVTGASRGIGKGIALGLGEAGATVYITGRTHEDGQARIPLSGSLKETADEVNSAGGTAIPLRCDHENDDEVDSVFDQIEREHGQLDILVNNVWGGYEYYNNGTEFWNEDGFWTVPLSRWDAMFQAGVRAHYVASSHAARMMVAKSSGLIVNVSAFAAFQNNMGVAYGVSKSADIRMVECMASELRKHHVAVVALIPGLVRTEAVLKAGAHFDLSNSESPQFIGRAVAALAADLSILDKSGKWFVVAELAEEYDFYDVDQTRPSLIRDAELSSL